MFILVRTPSVLLLLVWPLSLSLATTREISVDFSSSGYLDVSVPQVPLINLCIQLMIYGSSPYVFPHSEIHGSRLICSSPWLIAACHVFLRLLMPRHSPYALVCLNSFWLISLDISPWFSIQELLSTLKNSVFRFVYLAIFTITCAAEIVFLPLINFNFFGKTNLISNFVFFPVNSSSLVNLSVSSCSH